MNREFGVDSLRIVAALFIVSHHIEFSSAPIIQTLFYIGGSWALFYFFIISGYFLSYKDSLPERSIKTISRILSISMVWSIIYLSINIHLYGFFGGIRYFLSNILTNYFHLYFLIALIFGFLFLNFFELKKLGRYKLFVSIIIILFHFAFYKQSCYAHLMPFELPYTFIPYFLGIPFIFYGNYLAKNPPLKKFQSIMLVIIGFIICLIEGILFDFKMHYLGGIIVVIGVINFALNKPKILDWGKISTYGGRYGLGIYLIHPGIIYVYSKLNSSLNLQMDGILNEIFQPLIITIFSALIFHICYLYFPKKYKLLTGNQKKVLQDRIIN
jgi:hypothetical protein